MEGINNSDEIKNEICNLEKRKEELETRCHDFKGEYEKLKAKHSHDRKLFEKDLQKWEHLIGSNEKRLEELESEIEQYEELKKLSEEDASRNNDAITLNLDIVNSLNITITQLETELTVKCQQLKTEKDSHFCTLDKFTRLQSQMDILNNDLSTARKSTYDSTYRNENRIEQLENTIIELNSRIKEENDKMGKSKSVIMSLRNENREFEEELGKLNYLMKIII